MATRIQLRRDTAAQWASANPVLAAGEPGTDPATGVLKIGDGSTPWTSLPAFQDNRGGTIRNVLDYGATGDGVTIDGPAMQLAFDAVGAAGGGLLIIPAMDFALSGALRVYENTTVWAYGARITQRASGGGCLYNFQPADAFPGYTGRGNIQVLGGEWDCNAADGSTGTVVAGFNGLYFCHAENITVRDVTVLNVSSAHHVELNGVRGALVENCRFLGYRDQDGSRPYSEAIQVAAAHSGDGQGPWDGTVCQDIRVTRCYAGPSSRLGAPGRLIGNHAHTAPTAHSGIDVTHNRTVGTLREAVNALAWSNARVASNEFVNCGAAGVAVATVAGLPVDDVTVSDNLLDLPAGAGVTATGLSGAVITQLKVTDNTVHGANGNGVSVTYAPGADVGRNTVDGATSGLSVSLSDGISLTVNKLRNLTGGAMYVGGCARPMIATNTVDGCGTHGLLLAVQTNPTTDAMVSGNAFRDVAAGAFVRITGATVRTTITGNQGRKGTGAVTNAVTLDAGATGTVMAGNDWSGSGFTSTTVASVSTAAPKTDWAGGTALPGHNLI